MITLAWRMIVLGLLFWTPSLAERNNRNVNDATGEILNNEKPYHQSDPNYQSTGSTILDAPEAYSYPEKTAARATDHKDLHNFHSSISPSEEFRVAEFVDHPKDTQSLSASMTPQSKFLVRLERSIDGDSVDLIEPRNDLEVETRPMTNDIILKTAHEITGYDQYSQINPTSTKLAPAELDDDMSKSEIVTLTGSGEEERASPRARSLSVAKPSFAWQVSNATATTTTTTHANESVAAPRSSVDDRQGNSEIQEIINGFVKLLNGNVQVQVNTNAPAGKPTFPSRTRINNRGPPRITDVPPIIFDSPPQMPPNVPQPMPSSTLSPQQGGRDPHPYPFDISASSPMHPGLRPFVSGVPLPQQLVPTNTTKGANPTIHQASDGVLNVHPTNITSSSFIERVNQTHPKVSSGPLLSPVFVASQSEPKVNMTDKNITQAQKEFFNESKIEMKNSNKTNTTQSVVVKPSAATMNTSSILEIKPSATLPPLRSSAPAVIETEISDNSLPATGVGTAVVVLEPSTQEFAAEANKASTSTLSSTGSIAITSSSIRKRPSPPPSNATNGYFSRPGIVLDDPEYKPAGHRRPPPIISAPPAKPHRGDVFDVTVSAIQGPGSDNSSKVGHPYVFPAEIDPAQVDPNNNEVITNPISGQDFVSIDGKRTYLNLFDSSTANTGQITPTLVKNHPGLQSGSYSVSPVPANTKTVPSKPPSVWKKPTHPPVRIDTCIVGDDSTCDSSQHERCRTEAGVSSCHCRPGYTRRKHREPCHRVVSMFLSLRVDRMYDQHLSWSEKLAENDSAEYQQLEYEAGKAIDSALSMTPFSDLFLGAKVNNIYTTRNSNIASPVFVNMTIQLAESPETLRPPVKQDLQKHLMGVIQRRSNNIGSSALWVDNTNGVVSQIHDVDECSNPDLNDCHPAGKCTNVFGSFHCTCPEGYRDPLAGNNHRSGRTCETCDATHCSHRGECRFHNGQPVCKCTGSYYGAQCEIDGEVLGVAVGSSLVAILIIITTLACLCAWSRRWNKEQKIGSPIFGYMPSGGSTVKTPVMGAPPYQVSLQDRLRWAEIADAMAHANHYGPEPINGPPTRPSSTIFGYSLPHSTGPLIMPRLRPPSVHTLRTPESSTSGEEDRTDLLGRNFQVPRPKSRSSIANQSGIYYDVDYDSQQQSGEIFSTIKSGQPCIPLNTYTMGSRSHYFNFRS